MSETYHAASDLIVRGGADKSLARPTSRCRRMESIVSLERGVYSCAELKIFSCYRRCMSGDARDFNNIETRAIKFLFLQGKELKEIHVILRETLGEYAPWSATVKNWVAQFKRGDFSTCDAPRPGRPKTVTTPEIIDYAEYYSYLLVQLKDILNANTAGTSPRGSCSCTTMSRLTGHLQPRRNWPTWASNVLFTHTIFRFCPRRTTTCSLD